MPREEQAWKLDLRAGFKKLFERSRSSSRTPSEHVPATEGANNIHLPSNDSLELPRAPSKEESSSSSVAPSQDRPAASSTINEPSCVEANSTSAGSICQLSQTLTPDSAHEQSTRPPSSDLAPATSAAFGSQSQLASPVIPLLTSPAPAPLSAEPTPTPLSDLWARAFIEANDEAQKWIQKHGLDSSTGLAQPKDQIKELIGLVEGNKLSEQNEKPLKIEIGNQKIIVREYVADAVAFITMIGDAAITFAPPQASAPWAVAKAVLKIPVKQIEQKAALLGIVQWFTRIVRRGDIYAAIYNAAVTDKRAIKNLYDALLEVYKIALELLASSDTLFDSGIARQTLKAVLRPEGATGRVNDLYKKEQQLIIEVQACEASRSAISSKNGNDGLKELEKQLYHLSSPLLRMDKKVATLLERLEEKDFDELMHFVSSEMFGKSHAAVTDSRIEHTGNWLLSNRDFRAWQDISSSSAVLCLKGTVGTGKTYLTSKVVDYVKQALATSQHDEGFAFFYCNRLGPSMQDPIIVLRSFVRQLACKAFGEPGLIQSSLAQKCKAAKREGRDLGYKDCKTLIMESLNLYPKTTIILDALDESDITTYNLCTVLIEMMDESRRPVKIFISTRPDRKYMKAFQDKHIITLDASNQQDDIEKFLEEKLYSTDLFMERSQKAQDEIKGVFATRSCGMFRWVYLQVLERFLGSPGESSINYRKWAGDEKEFGPNNLALMTVCRYGLWYTLRDWWLRSKITTEMAFEEDDCPLTTLGHAVRSNCLPMCRYLVDSIDVTHPDTAMECVRAVVTAITKGSFDTIKFLIMNASIDVNLPVSILGSNVTAAQVAAMEQPTLLQWMLDQGIVDVEGKNGTGHTCGNILIRTVYRHKFESVQILLKAGANVNAAVHNGKIGSALVAAVECRSPAIVRLLLQHGADPNLRLNVGEHGSVLEATMTLPWWSWKSEERKEIQHMLLDAGADCTTVPHPPHMPRNYRYGSVLGAAAFWGHKEILMFMIDRVGAERATQALRRRPTTPLTRYFKDDEEAQRWKDTAAYLADEVGLSKETLHAIGFRENVEFA
ncbi:hypothetical protein TsFJ059_005862 [Trichoderma semiorbis]|uniref:Nephrocystin 3-like N-terminal domain-containing protein n=1 Tax=Trichoderma semiorbis TaxID=1491008 RepID=A0A9P8KK91_9HYPO|nr:hypothetical protein TsFJ059_005862 [Trichoderma semiorbis]